MRIDLSMKEVKVIASILSPKATLKIVEIHGPKTNFIVEAPDQFTKVRYVSNMIQEDNAFVYIEGGVLRESDVRMFHEIGLQFGIIKGDDIILHNVRGDNTVSTIQDVRRSQIRIPELVGITA